MSDKRKRQNKNSDKIATIMILGKIFVIMMKKKKKTYYLFHDYFWLPSHYVRSYR